MGIILGFIRLVNIVAKFEELYPGKHNFCRVFELPTEYPKDFCFGGRIPVAMLMVDWFEPWPHHMDLNNWEECKEAMLKHFLLEKRYIRKECQYLLLTEFGESMLFEAK